MPTLSELHAIRKRLKAQLKYIEREINRSTLCKTCNIQMRPTGDPASTFGGGQTYQYMSMKTTYECPRCKARMTFTHEQFSEREDAWEEWHTTTVYRRKEMTRFGLLVKRKRMRLSPANMGRLK